MRKYAVATFTAVTFMTLAAGPAEATHADVKQIKSILICGLGTDSTNAAASMDAAGRQAFADEAYDQISKA